MPYCKRVLQIIIKTSAVVNPANTFAMKLRHHVYGAPIGIVTYAVALLASIGGFLFGWYVVPTPFDQR